MAHRIFRALLAVTLMALAANRFLKYLWWTACSSAWAGIPKMAQQWRAAVTNASFNEWAAIALEIISIAVLFSILRRRVPNEVGFSTNAPRLILASAITLIGTGILALILSWEWT
jgi:hypothetical protein